MSTVICRRSALVSLADSIRNKSNISDKFSVHDLARYISDIKGVYSGDGDIPSSDLDDSGDELVVVEYSDLVAIADAARGKGSITDKLTLGQIKTIIDGTEIVDESIITDDWNTISINANSYDIGKKKPITFTYTDGTSETINFTIIDKNVDITPEGNYATLTFMADNALRDKAMISSTYKGADPNVYDSSTEFSVYLNKLLSYLPEDLQSVMVTVKKYDMFGWFVGSSKIFLPSICNLTGNIDTKNSISMVPTKYQYRYFADGNSASRADLSGNTLSYWTPEQYSVTSAGTSSYREYYVYYSLTGNTGHAHMSSLYGIVPCFCVGVTAS